MPRAAQQRTPPADSHIGRRPKVCVACRKVKHKCVPSRVAGQCKRCESRGEPCNYGEDAWKQWATHEIQRLSETVFALERRTRGEAEASSEPTEDGIAIRQMPSAATFPTADFMAITTVTQPNEIYGLQPEGENTVPSTRPVYRPVGGLSAPEHAEALPEIGSADPRPSVISKNIVDAPTARAMVTYFLHSLGACGTFGFDLRAGAYPLLERLEQLTPFKAGPEVEEDEEDPTIDIELGIGPEEITALALRAVFTGDMAAGRSALTWARGLGKLDASGVSTVSVAQLFGLDTPRREPTRRQSIRLILFAYVCRVYTAVAAEDVAPEFDPTPLCEAYGAESDPSREEEDEVLLLHARLARVLAQFCLWRQPGRDRGQRSDWTGLPFKSYAHEPDFEDAIGRLFPVHPSSALALWTPLAWYVHLRVYRDLPAHRDSERLQLSAARHALEALDEIRGQVAGLPLIYVEAARLAMTMLLEYPRRNPPQHDTLDKIERLSFALLGSSLPGDHAAPALGAKLFAQAQGVSHTLDYPRHHTVDHV
ncbi:unnamed protein product [Cutaneotrichosporon oleaginosum]